MCVEINLCDTCVFDHGECMNERNLQLGEDFSFSELTDSIVMCKRYEEKV